MSCLKQSMKNMEGRLSSLEGGTIQQSVEQEDLLPNTPFNSLEGFLEFDRMISNGKGAQLVNKSILMATGNYMNVCD